MTRFIPKLISENGWNLFVFDPSLISDDYQDKKITIFPDQSALMELLYPWHRGIPPEYLLEKYITPPENLDVESTRVLQRHSNYAVQKILLHYQNPSHGLITHGELLRKFFSQNSQIYEYYEFYLLIKLYFEMMCPIPFDRSSLPPMSRHIADQWESIREGKGLVKSGYEKLDKELDLITGIEDKIKNYKQNVLKSRFAWYEFADKSTAGMLYHFWLSEEGRESIQLLGKESEATFAESTKHKNDRTRAAKDSNKLSPIFYGDFKLCQCWFCGKFYELPKGKANNYSRYCTDKKCKQNHKNWITALERQGKSPDSLGLSIKTRGKT